MFPQGLRGLGSGLSSPRGLHPPARSALLPPCLPSHDQTQSGGCQGGSSKYTLVLPLVYPWVYTLIFYVICLLVIAIDDLGIREGKSNQKETIRGMSCLEMSKDKDKRQE